MRFKRSASILLMFVMLILVFPLQGMAENKLIVYTVNYPLYYFAERIGGEYIQVVLPAPPDVDPAFWDPDDNTVRQYQKADLIILNGAGYAKWTRKVSLPMLRMVDTSRAFKDELIHIETNVTHNHGPGGDHSHGGTAFTTWLDFSQAAIQAEAVFMALVRKLPAQKQDLTKNFKELQKDLLDLDKQMIVIGERMAQTPLFTSHPIYQYVARRYDMNIQMMMWDPDEDPEGREWQNLQEAAKYHPAKWMLWEGEPLKSSVKKLQDLDISSTVFTPCMNRPAEGDFLMVMQANIENLLRTYQ